MTDPTFILLYVANPAASAVFYADLLGKAPVDNSPTFALFVLDSGVKLGLWASHTVEPAPQTGAGATELAFPVTADEAVHAVHAEWKRRGLEIVQAPVAMDFGFTFTALDPDGHRLRVFAPRD
jgi:catechol 2,3-dioxygenase-like lactoylglutathione lyase family enzyme